MVYIVFNWDIILLNGTKVANGNAASDYTKIKLAKDYLSNPSDFMDWEKITHRSSLPLFPFPSAEYYEILRKRNAEIIVPNGVSTKYIDKIIFKSEKALSKFKNELNNDKIYSNYKDKIKIDSSYFKWE